MTGSIPGGGTGKHEFLDKANELKSSTKYDVELREGKGRGIYTPEKATGSKGDFIRAFVTPKGQQDRVNDRKDRAQKAADTLFQKFKSDYGDRYAKLAFEAAGVAPGFDMSSGELKLQKGASIDGGKLETLMHIAEAKEDLKGYLATESTPIAIKAAGVLVDIDLDDVSVVNDDGVPKTHEEFFTMAKEFVKDFVNDDSPMKASIPENTRKAIYKIMDEIGDDISDLDTEEMKLLQDAMKEAATGMTTILGDDMNARLDIKNFAKITADLFVKNLKDDTNEEQEFNMDAIKEQSDNFLEKYKLLIIPENNQQGGGNDVQQGVNNNEPPVVENNDD